MEENVYLFLTSTNLMEIDKFIFKEWTDGDYKEKDWYFFNNVLNKLIENWKKEHDF